MPITPFHFGPGAALHALAPQHISFLSFCAANVFIDFESLYNLYHRRAVVHAFFHTYVGATLIVLVVALLFMFARWFAARVWLPNFLHWRELCLRQVLVGAALGAYSHVLLDSLMHGDIKPLAPFSSGNGLLGAVPLNVLHFFCLALGITGAAGVMFRRFITNRNTRNQRKRHDPN